MWALSCIKNAGEKMIHDRDIQDIELIGLDKLNESGKRKKMVLKFLIWAKMSAHILNP